LLSELYSDTPDTTAAVGFEAEEAAAADQRRIETEQGAATNPSQVEALEVRTLSHYLSVVSTLILTDTLKQEVSSDDIDDMHDPKPRSVRQLKKTKKNRNRQKKKRVTDAIKARVDTSAKSTVASWCAQNCPAFFW
jgi:hypothetical protein